MDKYAVVIEDEVKVAEETQTVKRSCPACKKPLQDQTTVNLSICPTCGTKPFEDQST